jgi:hypothetical protein
MPHQNGGTNVQLHIMNNYPAKYESCRTNELRRVAFTKYIMKLHENVKVP